MTQFEMICRNILMFVLIAAISIGAYTLWEKGYLKINTDLSVSQWISQ